MFIPLSLLVDFPSIISRQLAKKKIIGNDVRHLNLLQVIQLFPFSFAYWCSLTAPLPLNLMFRSTFLIRR